MKVYFIFMLALGFSTVFITDLHIPSETGVMVKTKIEALRRYSQEHYKEKWVEMDSYSYKNEGGE